MNTDDFTHGVLYAIQELITYGERDLAIELITNSGINISDFESAQQESDYRNEEMYKLFEELQ